VQRAEQLLAALPVEHRLVERVDEHVGVNRRSHHEVPRQPHAQQLDTHPAGDLDEHHRQRDGDAPPAVQHRVEQRVARVAVVRVVADETDVVEQVGCHRVERGCRHTLRQRVEPGELFVDVQVAPGMGSDEECPHVEPASLLRPAHQLGEPVGDVHCRHATGEFRR
jgi:hypothetical protein